MGAWVIHLQSQPPDKHTTLMACSSPQPSHERAHHAEGTSKLRLMAGGSQGPIAYSRPEAPNYIATELPPAGQLGIQLTDVAEHIYRSTL